MKACLECLEEVADANLGSETLGLVLNLYCMVEALLILSPTVLRVLDSHDLKPPGKAESCWRAYNSESGKVDSLCAEMTRLTRSNYDQTMFKHSNIFQSSRTRRTLDIGAREQKTPACLHSRHGMCTNGLSVFVFEHGQPDQVLEYVEVS